MSANSLAVLGYVVMFIFTALITRAVQIHRKVPKRSAVERAEELNQGEESIPMTHNHSASELSLDHSPGSQSPLNVPSSSTIALQAPTRAQDPTEIRGIEGPSLLLSSSASLRSRYTIHQTSTPLTRAQSWAAFVSMHLDILTYCAVFCIGLPIFFSTGYVMPAQLSLNVGAYFAALELPPRWRRVLHPAMVASVITIVGTWVLAACHGDTFDEVLQAYQTRTRYIQLLSGKRGLPKPGAGDVFSSVLDVGIVSLSLPMFQYRNELKNQVGFDRPVFLLFFISGTD